MQWPRVPYRRSRSIGAASIALSIGMILLGLAYAASINYINIQRIEGYAFVCNRTVPQYDEVQCRRARSLWFRIGR